MPIKRRGARPKRGRPPKFGRPSRVVAITLPEEVVRGLKRMHADLAWAIVQLFEKNERRTRRADAPPGVRADAELLDVAAQRSLIVVNRDVFKELPGISLMTLHDNRAFLALEPGQGVADLELAVIDRMSKPTIGARERQALNDLRTHLRRWRRDPSLHCTTRSIIVVERDRRAPLRTRPTRPRAAAG